MAINKEKKTELLSEYKDIISKSNAIFFIDSQSTPTDVILDFKKNIKQYNCTLKVIKNTIFAKALTELDYQVDSNTFFGYHTAIFALDDPIVVAKEISKFTTLNKQVQVKFGLLEKSTISKEDVAKLSTIISKEYLLQQILFILTGGITNFARDLNSPATDLAFVISKISK